MHRSSAGGRTAIRWIAAAICLLLLGDLAAVGLHRNGLSVLGAAAGPGQSSSGKHGKRKAGGGGRGSGHGKAGRGGLAGGGGGGSDGAGGSGDGSGGGSPGGGSPGGGSSGGGGPGGGGPGGGGPGGGGPPPISGVKAPVSGIVAVDALPDPPLRQAVGGLVIEVPWSALQPTPANQLAPNNAIDQAISDVRQANAADGVQRGIRVRILAGVSSPDWLKSADGPPVSMSEPQSGMTGTIPRFWLPDFGAHYATLEALLAARYDSVPEVREVTVSRCTTFFAEPFQRQIASRADVQALLAAGYTESLDQACQRDAIAAHSVWHTTRSSLAFTPYQVINQDGSVGQDLGYTDSMMQYCRSVLSSLCVLENNSIRYPTLGGDYPPMYQSMSSTGRPIAFQTAAPGRVGDLNKTLDWAVNAGGGAVELLDSMIRQDASSLPHYNNALQANDAGC